MSYAKRKGGAWAAIAIDTPPCQIHQPLHFLTLTCPLSSGPRPPSVHPNQLAQSAEKTRIDFDSERHAQVGRGARELQTTSRSGRASTCACWQPMKRSRVANAPNNRGGQYAHIARDIKKAHTHPHMQKLVMKYIGSALSGYCPWSS